jgi:hypothetical protein
LSVKLYMDHHVSAAITEALRVRGIDVVTAEAEGTRRLADPDLLDRATEQNRVLFSQDEDLLTEAARRQQAGIPFAGLFYAHQQRATIGQCVRDLEFFCLAGEPEDFADRVHYLPLKWPAS